VLVFLAHPYARTTHHCRAQGRPILIGTTSVETSEELVQALRDLSVPAQVGISR
jgi:preprotein translocase subunit SecA